MKKILRIILPVIALGAVVFLFRAPLAQILSDLQNKYLPCSQPITYSLGSFDSRFGISKEEFLRVVNIAESTWEKSINKQLFTYVPDGTGDLKINLIYDTRQEASQKLKNIGITVSDSKASYNDLKSKYNTMQADYLNLKTQFESRVVLFQSRQNAYNQEVTSLNRSGGASPNDFARLNKEKNYLNTESVAINNLQTQLNTEVGNVNALAIVLNRLVSSLNIEVKKYNTIGGELGGEFEEGTYNEGPNSKEIDIYQFDNEGKLARVLTHEFGHALGLGHIDNLKAVMYRLNNGVNEKLTTDDITALKNRCGIK
jgi:hypothetical protein